jgi:alpha-beta hydrolase superfamily lysophospholipase
VTRRPLSSTPAQLNLPFETVHFPATDGTSLEGWKIAGDPIRPWVILCHGAGANRADLLQLGAGLYHTGMNLLLFDFRGHGGSAGHSTSFGWTEQHDLRGALAFLGQQPEIPPRPYGVYGASMGAAVAIMVAATDDRIGAVAAEGAYTELEHTLGHHLQLMYGLPPSVFLWPVKLAYRLRFGIWPSQVSPLSHVRALEPRPLLLIQGSMDTRTPTHTTQHLFQHAHMPKELWMIKGAGHLSAFQADAETYISRLAGLYKQALGAESG